MVARRLNWSPDTRLMVAGHPVPQNVFTLYAEYARSFFSGGPSPVLY